MKNIRNTLSIVAIAAAATLSTSAFAAQPNGRDSVYRPDTTQPAYSATTKIEQVPGRAGGIPLSTKLKAQPAGGNVADLVNRLGRA